MATKANLIIDQGADFSNEILLTDESGSPLDLSNYSVVSQIRKWYTSSNSVLFDSSIVNGAVVLTMNAETTSTLTSSRYLYDVVIINPANTVTRVVEGIITVNPSITKTVELKTYYTVLVGNVHGSFYTGDIVYQSNGTANVSGLVYDTNMPQTDIPNTMVLYVSNTNGAFVTTQDNSYRIYSTNSVSNSSSNASVIYVNYDIRL
jgi:hypothetical protein